MCCPHARARVSDEILFKFFAQLKQVRHFISFPPPAPWILHVHPLSQMFAPVRVVATIILIASMGLVFVGAFVLGNPVRILDVPAKLHVLGLTLFSAAVYKYVPDLFVKPRTPTDPPDYSLRNHRVSGVHLVRIPLTVDLWNHVSNRPPPFRYCLSYIPYARTGVLKMIGLG